MFNKCYIATQISDTSIALFFFHSTKVTPQKNSPSATKKDTQKPQVVHQNGGPKMATEVEKHASKVAALPGSKLAEPKVRVSALKEVKSVSVPHQLGGNGTGIPKPTLAVKGLYVFIILRGTFVLV